MKTYLSPRPARAGFTLIESLSVVLILGLVVALAAPTMLGAIRASRLTSAGELISGKIVEAQGLALTFSSDVELRFYKTLPTLPVDGRSGQFLQLLQWVENDPELTDEEDIASLQKIGPQVLVPDGVTLAMDAGWTSLWNLEAQTETTAEGDREYVAIRFRPDGSTDLPEAGAWHVTLIDQQDALKGELPANFYTLQIDPVTAKLEIYRPE